MNNPENLGFNNWFTDKVDLSKTNDFWLPSLRETMYEK